LDPHFRSDAHAEMIVMSAFEARWPNRPKQSLTLYTSLEPCPMCYARLLTSGIGRVVYLADDELAGMVHLAERMPPVWRDMAINRQFSRAPVNDELRQLAMGIFLVNGRSGSTAEEGPVMRPRISTGQTSLPQSQD
jgi:tRNA(Arg) A34 adenosine deaminase TadA